MVKRKTENAHDQVIGSFARPNSFSEASMLWNAPISVAKQSAVPHGAATIEIFSAYGTLCKK